MAGSKVEYDVKQRTNFSWYSDLTKTNYPINKMRLTTGFQNVRAQLVIKIIAPWYFVREITDRP